MLAKATRRVPWWLQMGVAAVVSLFAFGSWTTLNIAWEGFAKYYVFFIGGMYLRRYILGFARSVTIGRAVPVVLLWGTGAVLLTLRFGTSTSYLSLPFCVLGLAAGICISYYLAGSRLMRFLGSRTLPIYVCHTPFITLCAYALYSAGLPDRLPSWVGIVGATRVRDRRDRRGAPRAGGGRAAGSLAVRASAGPPPPAVRGLPQPGGRRRAATAPGPAPCPDRDASCVRADSTAQDRCSARRADRSAMLVE